MPFRSEFRRCTVKPDVWTWRRHILWLWKFYRWRNNTFREPVPATGAADTTAILLSYKRPQNIDLIIRLLLATPSIKEVIVSNNNPDLRLAPWISVRDPRVTLIEQPVRRFCRHRFELARRSDSKYFLAVDDDLFLMPSQMETLCGALRNHPEIPHGICGQIYNSWTGELYMPIAHQNTSVNVLSRVYAFSAEHVREFFNLVERMGFHPWTRVWSDHPVWDDLLISFSGRALPRIHDIGAFLDSPFQDDADIALSKQEGFKAQRFDVFCSLRKLKVFDR